MGGKVPEREVTKGRAKDRDSKTIFFPSLVWVPAADRLFIRLGYPLKSGKERMEPVLEQWPSESRCPSAVILGGQLSGMGLLCSE